MTVLGRRQRLPPLPESPALCSGYVEQVSADHARAYGMDHAFFRERRSAFLVGKQALRVWRMPGRAEKINLTTACEAFKKGTMKRLTTITSETRGEAGPRGLPLDDRGH